MRRYARQHVGAEFASLQSQIAHRFADQHDRALRNKPKLMPAALWGWMVRLVLKRAA